METEEEVAEPEAQEPNEAPSAAAFLATPPTVKRSAADFLKAPPSASAFLAPEPDVAPGSENGKFPPGFVMGPKWQEAWYNTITEPTLGAAGAAEDWAALQPSVSSTAREHLAGIRADQLKATGLAPDDLRMAGPSAAPAPSTGPPAVMEPPSPLTAQGMMTQPLPKPSFAHMAAFLGNAPGSDQMAVARGLDAYAQSLLTKENVAILGGTAAASLLVGPIAPLVVGGYFTVKMIAGLFDQFPDLKAAAEHAGETGDTAPFIEKMTEMGLTAGTAAITAAHTATGAVAGAKSLVQATDMSGLTEAARTGLSESLTVPKGVEPPTEATAVPPAVAGPVAEKTRAPFPVPALDAEALREGGRRSTDPPPEQLAQLLVRIGQRGDISAEDVPPLLHQRMSVEENLLGLQELVDENKGMVGKWSVPQGGAEADKWYGFKSVLPDVLQKYKYGYEDVSAIIQNGLDGERLTEKQQRFWTDAYDYYAGRPRGPISQDSIVAYLERHNSGSAAMELMFRDKQAAEGGQVAPDHLRDVMDYFGAEAAAERAAIGEPVPLSGVSGESSEMPTGDRVEKLNPPDTFFREAVRLLLDDPKTPADFQAAADWTLRPRYGIEAPVELAFEDVPLSRIEQAGNSWKITLPMKAEPYELLHEFAELRKRLGDPTGEPIHDNNVIADKFVKEATRDEGSIQPRFADMSLAEKAGIAESVKDFIAYPDEPASSASMAGAASLGFYGKRALESAKPNLEAFYDGAKDYAARTVNLLMPEVGAPVPTKLMLAEKIGATRRMVDAVILRAIQEKWLRRTMNMSDQELVKVNDEMKTAGELSDPVLRPFKAFAREMQDRNYRELLKYAPSTPYLENRLSTFYTPESVEALRVGEPAKYRSLTGGQRWMRQSVFESMSDAIEAGLVPRNYNPIQLLIWDIMDQRKFIDGHKLWQQAVASGQAVDVARDAAAPFEGWRRMDFDRRVLKSYLQDEQGKMPLVDGIPEDAQAEAKGPRDWYLEPNFYRLLANHLSRDLVRESPLFSTLLKYTMIDKAITLAVPAWHGTLETIGAAGSDIVGGAWRAGYELGKGTDMDGQALLGSVGRILSGLSFTKSPWDIARMGGKVKQLIANPEQFIENNAEWLKVHPEFQEEVESAFRAGAGWGTPADFRQGYFGAIKTAIQDRNPALAAFRAGIRLVPSLAEFIAGPMFNEYIPRLHWGVYLKEIADAKLRYADDIMSGKMDIQELRRRVWNSVYDRFGRVNYDNWFWNRTFKSTLQLLLLSPAWLGGDIRLAATGVARQASEIGQMIEMLEDPNAPGTFKASFSGRTPKLAPEMQALLSVLVPGVIISSIYQMAIAKKAPWETNTPLEDTQWPRTGGVDPDGHPKRVAFPGYGPAYWNMVHDPLKHLANSASPMLKRTLEAMPWNNRKFYTGEFVYNPEDSRFKQVLDAIRYAAFGNWPGIGEGPFFQQNLQRMQNDTAPAAEKAVGFLGVRPAPSYLDKTGFEEAVDRIRNRFLPTGKPHDEVERAQRMKTARQLVREGGDAAELMRSGDFSLRQKTQLSKAGGMTPYQSMFAQLGLKPALEAWRHISDAERQKYLPILRAKIVDPKTGEPKQHVWDSYPASEIPVIREELQRALSGR